MPRTRLAIWTGVCVDVSGHVCDTWPLIQRGGHLYVLCEACGVDTPVRIKKGYAPVEESLVVPVKRAKKVPVKRVRKPVVNAWLNL